MVGKVIRKLKALLFIQQYKSTHISRGLLFANYPDASGPMRCFGREKIPNGMRYKGVPIFGICITQR